MPRIYFWSRAELRNGIEDWKKITPPPVRKAVEALRKKFEEQAWKVGEIMRQGCHPALHKGMGDQARMISRGIERLGYSALPTVDEGQTETTVFTSYFYRCADLLAKEVRRTFLELLEISQVQSSVIDREPIDWAALQIRGLVADESCRIPLWTKNACDKQPYGPTANSDDVMCWKRWRAPKWFCMEPFADPPYDRAIAWQRMDETESKHVLLVVEDRFNQRLIRELDDAVGVAHVRLAKRANLPNLQAADKHSNLPDTR